MSVRLSFSHPSRKRLQAWLDGTAEEQITDHVEHCDRCAARIEEIADIPSHPELDDDPELGAAIREVFTPPEDLNERVMKKIDARERADREVQLLLGIFAIAKDAAELMMPPPPSADEDTHEDPEAETRSDHSVAELEQSANDETTDENGATGDEPGAGRE